MANKTFRHDYILINLVFIFANVRLPTCNKSFICSILQQLCNNASLSSAAEKQVREHSRIIDFNDRTAVGNAVKEAYAIVTATGIAGAAGSCCSPGVFIRSGALLANMGVEDEYGAQVPAAGVLVNKQPVNFIQEESTQMKYIDATMGLHNEGASIWQPIRKRPDLLRTHANWKTAYLIFPSKRAR